VLVAAAGVGVYLATREEPHARPAVPDAAVTVIDAAIATDAAAIAIDAVAAEITIRVTSTPPGATVVLDGKKLGKTPFEIKMPRSSVTVELKIRRDGYASKRIDVTLDKDIEVTATLKHE
jgi:hypothetical protein